MSGHATSLCPAANIHMSIELRSDKQVQLTEASKFVYIYIYVTAGLKLSPLLLTLLLH